MATDSEVRGAPVEFTPTPGQLRLLGVMGSSYPSAWIAEGDLVKTLDEQRDLLLLYVQGLVVRRGRTDALGNWLVEDRCSREGLRVLGAFEFVPDGTVRRRDGIHAV